MDIKNIFGKMDKPVTPPHSNVTRGPGGRFVSKKKKEAPKATEPPSNNFEEKSPAAGKVESKDFETSTFYGRPIRKVKIGDEWLFAVADMSSLANYPDPELFVSKIKNDPKTKKILEKEGKKIDEVDFVNHKGLSGLILALQTKDHVFPGPFLGWLKTLSEA